MTPETIGRILEADGASDEEIDEFLAHFGVKGMKWGVRRNSSGNPKSGDSLEGFIVDDKRTYDARKELKTVSKASKKAQKQYKKAKSIDDMQAAIDKYKKEVYSQIRTEKYRIAIRDANRLTGLDAANQIFALGPLAAATIPLMKVNFDRVREHKYEDDKNISRETLRRLEGK